MGCGACSGKKKGVVRGQANKSVQIVHNTPLTIKPRQPVTKSSGGTRAQPHRRCKKCNWPMNSTRRFDSQNGKQIQTWSCMNRKCNHREEA